MFGKRFPSSRARSQKFFVSSTNASLCSAIARLDACLVNSAGLTGVLAARRDVNVRISEACTGAAVEIIARPNASTGTLTLILIVVIMSLSVLGVALVGYLQGNVFAPLFALFDIALVVACLAYVWRRSHDHDRIVIDPREVRIERIRQRKTDAAQYPTAWVRIWRENADPAPASLFLGAYGRRTEIGSFLAHAQRVSLEDLIKTRLGEARQRAQTPEFDNVARGQTA